MSTAAVRRKNRGQQTVPPQPQQNDLDPAIQSIIDKGRVARPEQQSARGAWMLPAASTVLLWACFTPLNASPLAWLAIVPLCLLVRTPERPRAMYRWLYLAGFAWTAMTFQWMRLGHPSMYLALTALSVYLACYFPAFVALTRVAVHRFRVPLVVAVPVVWTGLEYVRAYMLTGVSWYYLGHSQYRWIELIQISDLVGAYGVSFVVATANAAVAVALPVSWLRSLQLVRQEESSVDSSSKQVAVAIGLSLTLVVGAVSYGYVRRGQASFTKGPRVAVVQGNFTSAVKHAGNRAVEIVRTHDMLTYAAMQHGSNEPNPPQRPELVIWPETMFPWPMCDVADGMTDEQLLRLRPANAQMPEADWIAMFRNGEATKRISEDARSLNAAMLVGINSIRATPEGEEHRNSVAFVTPQMGFEGQYDKMHLVMFGEYVPLKDYLPFLSQLTPYGSDFGLEAGKSASIFQYAGTRFAPVICFEDTVPHLVRGIVASGERTKQPVDFLVNNTNDGWFHGSSELDQHLITAAFRSVETRTPMVRAVNTGISAFIDGDGVIREPDVFLDGDNKQRGFTDESGRWSRQLNAVLIDNVPLDSRSSIYVGTGDVFAGTCGALCLVCLFGGLARRRKRPTPE